MEASRAERSRRRDTRTRARAGMGDTRGPRGSGGRPPPPALLLLLLAPGALSRPGGRGHGLRARAISALAPRCSASRPWRRCRTSRSRPRAAGASSRRRDAAVREGVARTCATRGGDEGAQAPRPRVTPSGGSRARTTPRDSRSGTSTCGLSPRARGAPSGGGGGGRGGGVQFSRRRRRGGGVGGRVGAGRRVRGGDARRATLF